MPLPPFPVTLCITPVSLIPVFPTPITLCAHIPNVPKHTKSENEVSDIATRGSSAAPLSPAPPKKLRIRRRRQARRAANRNSGDVSAAPLTPDARLANQHAAGPAGATQTQPEDSDPTSTRRTAVYPPS